MKTTYCNTSVRSLYQRSRSRQRNKHDCNLCIQNQNISGKLNYVKKNLRYIISEESVNDIKFTPYRLNSMTQNNTMIEIFIQQNSFLDIVKIILVFWIMQKDKEQVQDILGQSQYFTGMEPTWKSKSEGKHQLMTT